MNGRCPPLPGPLGVMPALARRPMRMIFGPRLACRDRMQKGGFGDAARSPEAFQAQSAVYGYDKYVAAGTREAGAPFQGRFPGNELGHAWRNNPSIANMRHIDGTWRGEAKSDDIWRKFREDGVYRHRLCGAPLRNCRRCSRFTRTRRR